MDVGFIPGIYNYCDRWCEKCEQQLRCMSFVMGKKIEEKGGFNFEREGHREDESIWARLKEVFESTYEVLHELAEERGLDVEDIYASENIDREFWGEDYEGTPREQVYQKLESSDLLRICSIYEYWADKCLEQLYEIINDKEKNELLEEALEVVGWYPDLIQAKIRRALFSPAVHPVSMQKMHPRWIPACSKQEYRFWASATACSSWLRNWAAKYRSLKSMNTATLIFIATAAAPSLKAFPKRPLYG